MLTKKCLYCYEELQLNETDFHAACSKKIFGTTVAPKLEYTFEQMSELAKRIVESSVAVTGVQPKLSLSYINDVLNDSSKGRLTILVNLGGNYILKPANINYAEMPENEHLTMRLAEMFGIEVVSSTLIRLMSGELCYLTKRIDRNKNEKNHMLDMFQILEAFDKYRGSMERISKAVRALAANTLLDTLKLFEITLFSYLVGNNDMHLKNFSMILINKQWVLSPAYDLLNVHLHIPEDKEEIALTIKGKKNKLTKEDFVDLGISFGLTEKQIENTFKKFNKKSKNVAQLIQQSFLSKSNQMKYISLFEERIKVF